MNAPPLLVSFSTVEDLQSGLSQQEWDEHGAEIRNHVDGGRPPAVSVRVLATLFGFSPRFVGSLVRFPERYYRTFEIPKGTGVRRIEAPRVALKVIQKWFGHHLARAVELHPSVIGFVPGRSAIQGAAVHCRREWVWSIDIEDFFPSISEGQIKLALESLGYSSYAAEIMTKLCSYQEHLAQGSPASPVLANLVVREVDAGMIDLASKYSIHYTRYADDMVFSGRGNFQEELEHDARNLVTCAGLRIAERKVRLVRAPSRLLVYGLVVNGARPRLTKRYRNRIRAYRHLLSKRRVDEGDVNRIRGHLAYAASVESADLIAERC